MGCGAQSGGRQVDLPKNLHIHGHILDNQTRSIMMGCGLSGRHFTLNEVNPLKNENNSPSFLAINPTGHLPMIEDGPYKVLGGNHLIYVYLCKSKAPVATKLMPAELE